MLVEIKVPVLAESVADVTLMDWHKAVGEPIIRGENLIDLETDKVTLEVAAPESGLLKEIRKQSGETALTDEILAVIDTDGVAIVSAPAKQEQEKKASIPILREPKMSPSVRQLVTEHGLDTSQINATGKDGRLTKADVMAHLGALEKAGTEGTEPPLADTKAPGPVGVTPWERAMAIAPQPPSAQPVSRTTGSGVARLERREGMSRLRQRTAERLLAAQHENAILSTFNEINMQPVMALRARYREVFEQKHGTRLGFMSFFAKACIDALMRFPLTNARVDGSDIVYRDYYDIGIAVSSPRGLVVPVLRDVDRMSFADIERQIREYGEKARDGELTLEDLTGGTFTITNGGVFGSLLSTPIINPPQSAILGMHKIQDRPVAEEGEVVIRPMMYVALSYDHRIINGREAVQFLVALKEQLEDPSRMLLGI